MKKITLLFLLVMTGCFSSINLDQRYLDTALLNEYYEYDFHSEHGWADWFDDTDYVSKTGGSLPDGMGIDTEGRLFGVPTELGNFRVEVTAYDVDYDSTDIFSLGEIDSQDEERFTLFVTEASTNESCPSPQDEDASEIYICAGDLSAENVASGDILTLDINFHVNPSLGDNYDVDTLVFSIAYDSASFSFDSDSLNSTLLREAATRSEGTVTFDNSSAGNLIITVLGGDKGFRRAGRLLDLPVTALVDLTEENYAFEVILSTVTSSSYDGDLPTLMDIDGSLTLTGLEEEEEGEGT